MKLSIVIVNFNTYLLTKQTIDSISNSDFGENYEIIVVDNSTKQEERYRTEDKGIKIVNCPNRGFGNACNIGAANSSGEFILLLNSDVILTKDTLAKSLEFLEASSAADIIGIRILLKNGSLDHGCKRGFPTPGASFFYFCGLDKIFPHSRKFGAYHQTFISETETAEIECISGAFMLMKKEVFLSLGGFDEDFFMHGEDIDLCFRAKEKGYKTVYFAETWMTHLKGQSSLNTGSVAVLKSLYKSMWLFYRKHYYLKYSKAVSALVFCGIKIKYSISLVKMRIKEFYRKERIR